jgi:hypothetical protein
MPGTARKAAYARQRARAITLERLAPVYRRRIISAIATCLADGRRVPRHWFAMLDDDELTQAIQLATKLAAKRRLRRIMTAIEAAPLRLLEACRRAIGFTTRSGPGSDQT